MTTDTEPGRVPHTMAVESLHLYCEARKLEGAAKDNKDAQGRTIRWWLDEHPGDELRDGELGISARLQPRQGSPQFDAPNASTEALRWLADHGCLKLDYATFKTLVGKFVEADDINRTLMPGGETMVLDVKEGK